MAPCTLQHLTGGIAPLLARLECDVATTRSTQVARPAAVGRNRQRCKNKRRKSPPLSPTGLVR
eukprot:scaffold2104_cov120-Isochrysis_galbana.AAC.6